MMLWSNAGLTRPLGRVSRQVRCVGGGEAEDDVGVPQQDGPAHHRDRHHLEEGLRHWYRDGPRQ